MINDINIYFDQILGNLFSIISSFILFNIHLTYMF